MQRTIPESTREHADLALAVYVEELAARRRVLFVGDAASAVPERLSSVARSVEVVSPRTRTRGTRRGGRILPRPWPSPQDAHSWDLVLVPDLLWAGAPATERIAEMAEWLTPRGVLVVGAEEREDGVDYESLYGLLSERFDWVRMLGQAPFSGWSVVDFATPPDEVEITFDGSLLGGTGEAPARFLALCAAREIVLDPYSIVQVPFARHEEAPRADSRELSTVRARAEQAERRLEQIGQESAKDARKLGEAREQVESLAQELAEARNELSRLCEPPPDEDHTRLESALAERAHELIELRHEIERRGVLVRDLVEELTELRRIANAVEPTPPMGAPPSSGSSEDWPEMVAHARARAVEAEAAVAEMGFRLDQLRGELALCTKKQESEREEAAREIALAQGTARGLASRSSDLEREVEDTRDQLKHALARVHDAPVEHERAVELEVESRNLARQLEHAEKELESVRDAYEAELREKHAQHSSELARLRGERDGLRLRLEDAEIAIASTRTAPALRKESALDEANAAREKETARADELAHRLTVRDAMIVRLKSEMADLSVTRDGLAHQVRELEKTSAELRESIDSARRFAEGQAESERQHARELENRMAELGRAHEREMEKHGETRRTLAEAREILAQLASGFDSDEERPSEFASSTSELGRQLRRAEARVEELERAAAMDARPERDAEFRRTQQLLGDRDAQLMALEERIAEGERATRAMREVFAESRAGLESLLAEIANDQRAEAADRIASMLRSLRRY